MTAENTVPQLTTINALAEEWQMSRGALYQLCARKKDPLPHYRIGHAVRLKREEVDAWLERQRQTPRRQAV